MQKENINLAVTSDGKSPIEIILREGVAAVPVYPRKIVSSGLIDSAYRYSSKVKDKEKALIEFSLTNLTIKLFADPSDEKGAEINGVLSLNPDMIAFGINKGKFFSNSELVTFVRKYAHCFKDVQDAKDLIKTLQNFEVKFEQTHVKNDDRKGATEDSVKNAITFHKGEVKSILKLSMPTHLGCVKVDFEVEIEIEKQGTAPGFAFYSLDLETLIRSTSEAIMEVEINRLRDFVCIQIS